MRKRREFPTAVRIDVVTRATVNKVIYCESCKLPAKKFQIDHVIPDGMGGQPILSNAELICEVCYGIKNPSDTTKIAKAKRVEAAELRVTTKSKAKIPAPPSAKSQRVSRPPAIGMSEIARRFGAL